MKEPIYRWVCTMCGISDEAESSEMARIAIDVHVGVAHPSAGKESRGPDPARLLVVGDEGDDQGGAAARGGDGRVRP